MSGHAITRTNARQSTLSQTPAKGPPLIISHVRNEKVEAHQKPFRAVSRYRHDFVAQRNEIAK
jgi:hypothetical protein